VWGFAIALGFEAKRNRAEPWHCALVNGALLVVVACEWWSWRRRRRRQRRRRRTDEGDLGNEGDEEANEGDEEAKEGDEEANEGHKEDTLTILHYHILEIC
jgi:hypothetical protein